MRLNVLFVARHFSRFNLEPEPRRNRYSSIEDKLFACQTIYNRNFNTQ